jgi:hypothetical protein
VLAAHNVIVVGVPQSGKSTLTRAFLPALAKVGQLCIIDPHDQANDWPWQAIGSGRDYQAIGQTLARLTDEMTRRYQQRGPHPPLNVVIDEVPSITLHIKREWETHYPQLVFEGAKAGIKTWVLTQSAQVRPLGLEGKGDLRSSLTWLYLGEQAIERCPACAAQPYPAAADHRLRPAPGLPLPLTAGRQRAGEPTAKGTPLECWERRDDRPSAPALIAQHPQNAPCSRSVGHHDLTTNPMLNIERVRRDPPTLQGIGRAQAEAILAVIPKAQERDRLLFRLLLETGLRIGEALHLYVEDLDLTRDDEHLRVRGRASAPFLTRSPICRLLTKPTRARKGCA